LNVDPLRRNLDAEQPSGACASDPPDAARGVYADYVARLEDQIAGRAAAGEAQPPTSAAKAGSAADSRP
jgi:hypothetical protein